MFALSPLLKAAGLSVVFCSVAAAAPISLDGLVSNSPFVLQQEENAAPAPTENSVLELRGMITTKEGILFGLFDRTKNTGTWVRQDDSNSDFKVSGYDASSDMVTVEYQGQRLNLTLATPKIGSAAPSPLPVVNAQPAGGNRAVPAARNGTADAQRLESVAAEVRRRRALRQAAAGAKTAPAQTSGQNQ